MTPHQEKPQSHEHRVVCDYQDIDQQTRNFIEGPPFDQLPSEITLDSTVENLLHTVRQAVEDDIHRQKTSPILAELQERIRKHFSQQSDDPNAQAHLRHAEKSHASSREVSQQIYLLNGQIILGEAHIGGERYVSREKNLDNIDDRYTIVRAHTHPRTSPFSRGDFAAMAKSEQNKTDKCLYLLAAGDIDLVAIVSADSPNVSDNQLRKNLKLHQDPYDYFEELEALATSLPEQITNKRQRQFAAWFLDNIDHANEYKIGIYAKPTQSKDPFRRINNQEDILSLMEKIQQY